MKREDGSTAGQGTVVVRCLVKSTWRPGRISLEINVGLSCILKIPFELKIDQAIASRRG